jgi:hypothetical protein
MKKFAVACALAAACIAVITGTAGAHTAARGATADSPTITWGVADDTGKYADDGGVWFNQELKGAGLSEERWTLSWSPDRPTTIDELPFLQRAAPQAQKDGIKVELALYGRPASAHDPDAFCNWAGIVAKTVSQWGIHDYIVWNEPNTQLYWSPQDATAPVQYEALLAKCYDALHANDQLANVIGFGLSPRSNGPTQTAPIPFIKAVGAALKASGRQTQIMDSMSVHPYPNPNSPTDSPDVGYANTDFYGIPNLDRVKQAVYDAFKGTPQPTTVGLVTNRSVKGVGNALNLVIDELGWQTDTSKYQQYVHDENVKTVDEATQTSYLKETVEKYFACDPSVSTVNLFLLVDEKYRDGRDENNQVVGGGWQSGLLTAGGQGVSQPKQAYSALASDFSAGRAACHGQQIVWTPQTAGGPTGTGVSVGKPGPNGRPRNSGIKGTPVCKKGQHSSKKKPCRKK